MSKKFVHLASKLTITDTPSVLSQVKDALNEKRAMIVAFANAHAFNMAHENDQFFQDLSNVDLLLRDGIGVKILLNTLATQPGENLNGTDLIPAIINNNTNNVNIALWGTTMDVLELAKAKLTSPQVNIVSLVDGFQTEDIYIAEALKCKADIIVLAMGMPKQERVAQLLKEKIDEGIILCGGAIVDFIGGKVVRAPAIFRKIGLEWLYRLCLEPKRLFKRYVIGNFLFLLQVIKIKLS